MSDHAVWIAALRRSHDHFTAVLSPLDDEAMDGPSYDSEWTIGQVASHLGSQAEIFGLFLDAGLAKQDAPQVEQFRPIWERWDAWTAQQQVAESLRANEEFVSRLENLPESERDSFALEAFGQEHDLSGLAAMRLGEHALHTWDIAVALDPAAVVAADAVGMLIEVLPGMAGRAGKPADEAGSLAVSTVAPQRDFTLTTGPAVSLTPAGEPRTADLTLPAEALIRLVYGRLDPEHTPADIADESVLTRLRSVFPGF